MSEKFARDITFRGKSKTTGEWLYGSLINGLFCSPDGNIAYILDVNNMNYNSWEDIIAQIDKCEVILSTVGQDTEINDVDGDRIYEGMIVHQKSVLVGSPNIDFTGEVKFYDGVWFIDNFIKQEAVPLFNETCEVKVFE